MAIVPSNALPMPANRIGFVDDVEGLRLLNDDLREPAWHREQRRPRLRAHNSVDEQMVRRLEVGDGGLGQETEDPVLGEAGASDGVEQRL